MPSDNANIYTVDFDTMAKWFAESQQQLDAALARVKELEEDAVKSLGVIKHQHQRLAAMEAAGQECAELMIAFAEGYGNAPDKDIAGDYKREWDRVTKEPP